MAAVVHLLRGRRIANDGARAAQRGSQVPEIGGEPESAPVEERSGPARYSPSPCCDSRNAVSASIPEHIRERYIEFDDIHLKNMDLAKRLGVPIAMGTDAGTPGNHHGDNGQELVRMVDGAGFTPHEAVLSATLSAATMLRREADLGSLDTGKYADVIGFADDPLADINAIRDVRLVIKGGEIARNEL